MYRNDHDAAYERAQKLERELKELRAQKHADAQKVAYLEQNLHAAQSELARIGGGGGMPQYQVPPHMLPSNAGSVLVLGILAITVCSILGPIAWSQGTTELQRIDAGLNNPIPRGSAVAGRILGMISTAFLIIGVFFFLFLVSVG